MRSGDFTWALDKVFGSWRERRPKQARNTLPPSYTASTLRYIRIQACKQAAPDTIDCAKWSPIDLDGPDPAISLYPLRNEKSNGPFLRVAGYVCDKCKHPPINTELLITKLGLTERKKDFSVRSWQRYINDEKQMPVDQFRRVVAHAHLEGWLGLWQTISTWIHIDQLQATQRGLLAVFRRASERQAYVRRKEFNVSEAEIEQELEKQLRLIGSEAHRTVAQRLKDKNLPPELRQFMEETLFTAKGKS